MSLSLRGDLHPSVVRVFLCFVRGPGAGTAKRLLSSTSAPSLTRRRAWGVFVGKQAGLPHLYN